jgi:hypothetical protein
MSYVPTFQSFKKIPRFSNNVHITEKIDGTNAQICIEHVAHDYDTTNALAVVIGKELGESALAIYAGSRNRWLTRESDNYGFAKWVWENAEELSKLEVGRHFGEWWGSGIQRRYNQTEKRFSLFNAGRWEADEKPECCGVVPTLYQGRLEEHTIPFVMEQLKRHGSVAAPGFMEPEGIIVYHKGSGSLYKKTFDNDVYGKESAKAADALAKEVL